MPDDWDAGSCASSRRSARRRRGGPIEEEDRRRVELFSDLEKLQQENKTRLETTGMRNSPLRPRTESPPPQFNTMMRKKLALKQQQQQSPEPGEREGEGEAERDASPAAAAAPPTPPPPPVPQSPPAMEATAVPPSPGTTVEVSSLSSLSPSPVREAHVDPAASSSGGSLVQSRPAPTPSPRPEEGRARSPPPEAPAVAVAEPRAKAARTPPPPPPVESPVKPAAESPPATPPAVTSPVKVPPLNFGRKQPLLKRRAAPGARPFVEAASPMAPEVVRSPISVGSDTSPSPSGMAVEGHRLSPGARGQTPPQVQPQAQARASPATSSKAEATPPATAASSHKGSATPADRTGSKAASRVPTVRRPSASAMPLRKKSVSLGGTATAKDDLSLLATPSKRLLTTPDRTPAQPPPPPPPQVQTPEVSPGSQPRRSSKRAGNGGSSASPQRASGKRRVAKPLHKAAPAPAPAAPAPAAQSQPSYAAMTERRRTEMANARKLREHRESLKFSTPAVLGARPRRSSESAPGGKKPAIGHVTRTGAGAATSPVSGSGSAPRKEASPPAQAPRPALFCTECGQKHVSEQAKFCAFCGEPRMFA